MVIQKVGYTKDVLNFLKRDNCSFYENNNHQNNHYVFHNKEKKENNTLNKQKINNFIHNKNRKIEKIKNEYDQYNGFKIKSYGDRNIYLDLSNTFNVNNNNNIYHETYNNYYSENNNYSYIETINDYSIPQVDILKSLKNIEKDEVIGESNFHIKIDTSNIIKANNNNNQKSIYYIYEEFKNNYVEENIVINKYKNEYNKYM